MGYNIMVIDSELRFKNSREFLNWYETALKYEDDINYDDYRHATDNIQQWFMEIKEKARPMNGEFAPPEEECDCGEFKEVDYSIGKDFIYADIAYSDAEALAPLAFDMATKYGLTFFDVSGTSQVFFPDGRILHITEEACAKETYEEEAMAEYKRRCKKLYMTVGGLLIILLALVLVKDTAFVQNWNQAILITYYLTFLVVLMCMLAWVERAKKKVLKLRASLEVSQTEPRLTIAYSVTNTPLDDLAWNFREGEFDNQEDFFNAVVKYNEEVQSIDGEKVKEILGRKIESLGSETRFVLFDEDSEEAERQEIREVHLTSDDGISFSAGEILFKLNRTLYPMLADSDAIFFEGFSIITDEGSIHCRLHLGS
ncbi:MAG: hypothetical protein Q4F52_04435 [Bacteroidaceae bacterium]|nr:hypothetical protein [Bacteroidaceae bacterium]